MGALNDFLGKVKEALVTGGRVAIGGTIEAATETGVSVGRDIATRPGQSPIPGVLREGSETIAEFRAATGVRPSKDDTSAAPSLFDQVSGAVSNVRGVMSVARIVLLIGAGVVLWLLVSKKRR